MNSSNNTNEKNYKKANKSSTIYIILFIILFIGIGITVYYFLFLKNDNSSTSTSSEQPPIDIINTYGNINSDGQNNGYYNVLNGLNKNYSNKANGIDLKNQTVCIENNGNWENNKCKCLAPFYGSTCKLQDFNLDYYLVHAKIYYDDGIQFIKSNLNLNSTQDYEIYNIYPAYKNGKTDSMLEYTYNGRYSWYTKLPNGSLTPNVGDILTPTAYASLINNIKGIYIFKDDIGLEKCYLLRGIYVIELLDKNDPEYDNFVILMKRDKQFDFSIKDKMIGIPEPTYSGAYYTPKPYFEYDNIDLDCKFYEGDALNPIVTLNTALTQKLNLCFYPNPMIILNGKIEYLKLHDGKKCPISTSQYPFGVLDTFQCSPENNNNYPCINHKGVGSIVYNKLKTDALGCNQNCNKESEIEQCQSIGSTGNDRDGDTDLQGCLRCIRDYATSLTGDNKEKYTDKICRQLIPSSNVGVFSRKYPNLDPKYGDILEFNVSYSKAFTCSNTRRCQYEDAPDGEYYGYKYWSYLTPSQLNNLSPSTELNAYNDARTSYGKDFWSYNTVMVDNINTVVLGLNNSFNKFKGFKNNPPLPSDINPVWRPCCEDTNNNCFYDINKLYNFRRFGNYYVQNRNKNKDIYQTGYCYSDYNIYNQFYDAVHLNNFRPRGLDTYSPSFYFRDFFYSNYYDSVDNIKMQSLVKIKLPEYTYIVNVPSEFDMNVNSIANSNYTKWPQIYNNAMSKESGLDESSLFYYISSLMIPPENPYYQSLGFIPCSTRCSYDKVLSSSVDTSLI